MLFVDTHAHLYAEQFLEDQEEMLKRSFAQDVKRIYLPNIDRSSIPQMLNLEARYPEQCFPMMGLHPCSVKENYQEELDLMKNWLEKRPFCAIGEIGIDLYWDKTYFEQQKDAFQQQISWAIDLDLPIVIHSRDATDIIIDILRKEKKDKLRGIFHCFGGSLEQAKAIIDLDFFIGIGGVLTFKKSGLDKTVVDIPLERIVLETDAPYLAPSPFRGKRNESAYIRIIAEKLAELKDLPLEEIAKATSDNATKIFGWSELSSFNNTMAEEK